MSQTHPLAWAFSAFVLLFAAHQALLSFGGVLLGGGVATALLALVLLSATGSGRLLLRAFGTRDTSESEKTLIGATLGLGLLSQGVMLLGFLGALRTWTVSLLLGLLWVAGFTEMRDLLRSLGANANLLRDRPAAAGGVLALLTLAFLATWVPPHQYDSLVYHLALADEYARTGSVAPVGHLLFSLFPQNAEMLYTLALLLGSDLLAQMFTWLGLFLSVWWLFEMGKREAPLSAVLAACLLLTSHTAVLLLGGVAYVECLVMLWVTAAVFSFFRWWVHADDSAGPRGWLALAGVFAGLGAGTKYYAGICPAVLAVLLAGRWLRSAFSGGQSGREAGRDLALFCAAAAALGAPWYVRNLVEVGNPVFPFLYRLWPPSGVGWTALSASRYFDFLVEYGHSKSSFLADLLQFPYLAASGSPRFGGGADVLGNLGWGLLFAAAPAAVWAVGRNRYLRLVLGYVAAHWALWFCTAVVLRFLVVLVPLAALLAGNGLYQLWGRLGPGARACLGGGLACLGALNLALFAYVQDVVRSPGVLLGAETRHEFLGRLLDYYPCARFAREKLPREEPILVVGEQRGYYVAQPHVTTTPMAPNDFVRMANEASGPEQLARRLRWEGGFRHVLLVPREAKRLGEGYGVFAFTDQGYANWSGMQDADLVRLEHEVPGRCALYRIQ